MIDIQAEGSFVNTQRLLQRLSKIQLASILERYGQMGVDALSAATPTETGATAHSWGYHVDTSANSASITWTNSHMAGSTPLVILLEYGHGTGTGGYVVGHHFIKPAIQPILAQILSDVRKVVTA